MHYLLVLMLTGKSEKKGAKTPIGHQKTPTDCWPFAKGERPHLRESEGEEEVAHSQTC